MKFTPLRFILSPILVLLFNTSFAQEAWTLASCVEYAKAHNLDIQKAGNSVKNIEVQELQSKLAFLPTANLNGGYIGISDLLLVQYLIQGSQDLDKPLVLLRRVIGPYFQADAICFNFSKLE